MRIAPQLVEGCRRGDSEAFERLVRETYQPLYTLVFRLVGNHDDASDVLQETYIRVWRSVRRFRGQADFGTWMHRIATNAALTHLKRRSRAPRPVSEELLLSRDIAIDQTEGMVDADALQQALMRLTPQQRTAVVLKDVYGWSMDEIGQAVGMSEGAVKLRVFRARRRLAEMLGEERPAKTEISRMGRVVPIRRKKAK